MNAHLFPNKATFRTEKNLEESYPELLDETTYANPYLQIMNPTSSKKRASGGALHFSKIMQSIDSNLAHMGGEGHDLQERKDDISKESLF